MKKSLQIILLGALLMGMPMGAMAQSEREDVETEISSTNILLQGTRLRVINADGETLRIYSLTGTEQKRFHIEGSEVTLSLNFLPRGSYIVKVGKLVRKITIR